MMAVNYNFFTFLMFFVLLSGCSNNSNDLLIGSDDHPNSYAFDVSDKAKILFFFEEDKSKNKESILVHSEDRLLGALLEDLYFSSYVCPGEEVFRFEKRQKSFQRQDTVTIDHYINIEIKDTSTIYMGVSVNADDSINVQRRDKNVALSVLNDSDYKTFLVNRKVEDCLPTDVMGKVPTKLTTLDLPTDDLFPPDSSTLIEATMKKAFINLSKQLNSTEWNVTKMTVTGYSDRLGNPNRNQVLSKERAIKVTDYIKRQGVSKPINSVGFGSMKAITGYRCLDYLPREVLITCLKQDRRISIELWGDVVR